MPRGSTYSVAIFLSSASFFLFWKELFFLLDLEEKRDIEMEPGSCTQIQCRALPKDGRVRNILFTP